MFISELRYLKLSDCLLLHLVWMLCCYCQEKGKYKRHQNKSRKSDGERRRNVNRNLQKILLLASITCTKVSHEQRSCQTDRVFCIATLQFNTLFIACVKVRGLTSILPGLLHSHLQCHIHTVLYVVCFNREYQFSFSISSLFSQTSPLSHREMLAQQRTMESQGGMLLRELEAAVMSISAMKAMDKSKIVSVRRG